MLKLYRNLNVTSQISVLKQIKEAILGTSLERLTISVTSAPFITENEVVCTNGKGDKNCSYKFEKYCKTYNETCESDSELDRTKRCKIHFPEGSYTRISPYCGSCTFRRLIQFIKTCAIT